MYSLNKLSVRVLYMFGKQVSAWRDPKSVVRPGTNGKPREPNTVGSLYGVSETQLVPYTALFVIWPWATPIWGSIIITNTMVSLYGVSKTQWVSCMAFINKDLYIWSSGPMHPCPNTQKMLNPDLEEKCTTWSHMDSIFQWFGTHTQTPKMLPSRLGRKRYQSEAIWIKFCNGLEPMPKPMNLRTHISMNPWTSEPINQWTYERPWAMSRRELLHDNFKVTATP